VPVDGVAAFADAVAFFWFFPAVSCFFDFSLAFGDLSPMGITVGSCVDSHGRPLRRVRPLGGLLASARPWRRPRNENAGGRAGRGGARPGPHRPHPYCNHSKVPRFQVLPRRRLPVDVPAARTVSHRPPRSLSSSHPLMSAKSHSHRPPRRAGPQARQTPTGTAPGPQARSSAKRGYATLWSQRAKSR